MSVLSDLEETRDNLTAQLKALKLTPTTSVSGQTFQHDSNLATLIKALADIRLLIIKERGTTISRTRILS